MTYNQILYQQLQQKKWRDEQDVAIALSTLQETERHNTAVEAEAQRHNQEVELQGWDQIVVNQRNAASQEKQAEASMLNARTNQEMAEINRFNAETNRLNYQVNLMNAHTNQKNAESNRIQAEAARSQAGAAWANAATNARMADIAALNAQTNQYNAETNRLIGEYNHQVNLERVEIERGELEVAEKQYQSQALQRGFQNLQTVANVGLTNAQAATERQKAQLTRAQIDESKSRTYANQTQGELNLQRVAESQSSVVVSISREIRGWLGDAFDWGKSLLTAGAGGTVLPGQIPLGGFIE